MTEEYYKGLVRECISEFERYFQIAKDLNECKNMVVYRTLHICIIVKKRIVGSLEYRLYSIERNMKKINLQQLKFIPMLSKEEYKYSEKIYTGLYQRFNDTYLDQDAGTFSVLTFRKEEFYSGQVSPLSIDDEELIENSFNLFSTKNINVNDNTIKEYIYTLIIKVFEYRNIEHRYNFIKKSLASRCCIKPSKKYTNKSYRWRQNTLKRKIEEIKELMIGDGAPTVLSLDLMKELEKAYTSPNHYISKIDKNIKKASTQYLKIFFKSLESSTESQKIFFSNFKKIPIEKDKELTPEELQKQKEFTDKIDLDAINEALSEALKKYE